LAIRLVCGKTFFGITAAAAGLTLLVGWAQPSPQVLETRIAIEGASVAAQNLIAGDAAPNFKLKTADGQRIVELSELRGKPVALVFGSLTCPVFRDHAAALRELYEKYRHDVQFYLIYIREAHPITSAGIHEPYRRENAAAGIEVPQPANEAERASIALQMCTRLPLSLPALVDNMEDTTSRDYTAYPIRLYLVGRDGRIAYRGARGPSGFDPQELEAAIQGESAKGRALRNGVLSDPVDPSLVDD
jgi:cytochrome oxidase Cu insertion factor (SCO1/SenC/PrrC family)